MGNEQVCCLENENNQTQIKNVIIKKLINDHVCHQKSTLNQQSKIQQGINIIKRNKAIFSGTLSINHKQQKDTLLKKSNKKDQFKKIDPSSQVLIQTSQHILQANSMLLPQPQNPENQSSPYHNQTLNDNKNKRLFQQQQQDINIKINPNVNKLINILRPFEKQFIETDNKEVKKIRLNQGKDIYKGQIDENGKPYGIGMIIKQNGNIIIGNFVKGLIQGQSYALFNDGSYYKGKMKNSHSHDQSGYFYSQKFTYIGGFKNNLFHGKGQQIGIDHYFQGVYENNRRKCGILGWGIVNPRESLIVEKNKQEKQTIKIHRDNNNSLHESNVEKSITNESIQIKNCQFIYQGQFDVHQLFTGKGKVQQPKGIYIGEFSKGMKHGKGEYLYKEQIKYVGQYENDYKSGYGILYNCDGTIAYEGQWRNGLPDGKGFSYDISGRKTQGKFIQGINSKILLNQ